MIHSILYVDRCDAVLGKVKVHMLCMMLNDVLFASQRLIPVLELNFFALQLLSSFLVHSYVDKILYMLG